MLLIFLKNIHNMESIYKNCIVYCLWINGRCLDDVDQHFPIESYNIKDQNIWHSDFKKAYKDYNTAKVKDSDNEYGYNSEIFQDYIVTLYSIDIDIEKFETVYNLKFDLEDDRVQDCIPYYINYNFNTIAERLSRFKK